MAARRGRCCRLQASGDHESGKVDGIFCWVHESVHAVSPNKEPIGYVANSRRSGQTQWPIGLMTAGWQSSPRKRPIKKTNQVCMNDVPGMDTTQVRRSPGTFEFIHPPLRPPTPLTNSTGKNSAWRSPDEYSPPFALAVLVIERRCRKETSREINEALPPSDPLDHRVWRVRRTAASKTRNFGGDEDRPVSPGATLFDWPSDWPLYWSIRYVRDEIEASWSAKRPDQLLSPGRVGS
ncbi:hypothetical protein B0H16DRAFT_1811214 [Mycena metata]|uniref:Uncharacterized protein n=1 Tax=Mycena metata TaxID=1033252 RepID=A0AAD7NGJ9_9AGAR|nr:hypothetical protein B0H16DRAFT_1811214 [Mycena metata]